MARVVADAFCHNMVRALAGALLAVGDGSRPPAWVAEVLTARVRDPAVRVAPPHPLCLEEVRYPAPADLAARARLTRQLRVIGDAAGPGRPGRYGVPLTRRLDRLTFAVPANSWVMNVLSAAC